MMGRKDRAFASRVEVSLGDLVPAGHFYRQLERTLDLAFVRDLTRDCYASGGRPGIDPVVFFKLQLVLFFEGLRSERQLMRHVADRLSLRWYLGYDLGESLPDHSSLTRIRDRYGLAVFRRFFDHVVQLCVEANLVWGEELFFDATKVRANAALDSLAPRLREVVDGHLVTLFPAAPAAVAQGAAMEGGTVPEPTPVDAVPDTASAPRLFRSPSASPSPHDTMPAEQSAPPATRWALLEACRLDPDRPASRGYERTGDWRVSTTDADAAPMRAAALGYHDHYVVDGGKARIILHVLVTPADVMENEPMLDQLRRVQFRWRLRPKRVVADTTYGTAENVRALEDAGIRAYVPLPDFDERTPYFGTGRFAYEAQGDSYRCPAGQPLRRRKAKHTEGVIVYRAEAATCNACALKAACTASDRGRTVHRSFHAAALERVRGYHATADYRKAMRKRQVWVEPLFAEAKQWHGLRQFRLRGLREVNVEGLLVAAGQNLKRLLAASGCGRRHGPTGSFMAATPISTRVLPPH